MPPFDPAVLGAKGSLFLTRPGLNQYIATRDELVGARERSVRVARGGQAQGHDRSRVAARRGGRSARGARGAQHGGQAAARAVDAAHRWHSQRFALAVCTTPYTTRPRQTGIRRAERSCPRPARRRRRDRGTIREPCSGPGCRPPSAKAFGAEHAAVDPMVRRSERADFQADLAMGLAKALKRPPRQVAEAVVAAADLADICRARRDRGPRLHQPHAEDARSSSAALAARRARRAPRRAARGRQGTRRHRLLGAERREGDARRASALDDHRRRARAAARVRGPRRHPAEPHRRLGHAVRHADRAPARRRRGRRAGEHGRAQRLLSRGAREVRRRPGVRRSRAAARRAAASRRRAHARAVAAARRRSRSSYFSTRLRAARRRRCATSDVRGESATTPCSPTIAAELERKGSRSDQRRRAVRRSRRDSRIATASRCR